MESWQREFPITWGEGGKAAGLSDVKAGGVWGSAETPLPSSSISLPPFSFFLDSDR